MASSLSVLDGSLPEDLNNYGKQFKQNEKCEFYVVIYFRSFSWFPEFILKSVEMGSIHWTW